MKRKVFLVTIVLSCLIIGCSGGSSNSPVDAPKDIPQAKFAESNHMTLGLWQFIADPVAQTLEYVQLRSTEMHLNALPFLEPPPLLNLTLETLEFDGMTIDADIGLRHPFLGLTEFTGFDVCGVLISSGSVTGFQDASLRMPGNNDTRLVNLDGLARWWNPAEFPNDGTMFGYKDGLLGTPDGIANFDATINGYKLFCDDIANPDDPVSSVPITSRCVFSAGQKNVRHYTIELGSQGMVFNYAIDANWEYPQGDPPWTAPDDFSENANRVEAWNISVTETSNGLWNDGVNSGGSVTMTIDVWDHFNAGLNSVYADSPGYATGVGPFVPTGGGTGYSTYEVEILNATPPSGQMDILITVESEAIGYQGLLPGEPVSAYFLHSAAVGSSGDMPPIADAEIVTPSPFCPGNPIEFDASASYDPDGGNIVSYEWDFDGDGTYGDSYDSGTDSNPTIAYVSSGVYDVDVRVTDDENDTDTLDTPLNVTVGSGTWVDDDAVPPYTGSFSNPWPTIQQGLDNLNSDCPGSGWVLVKDGTYVENIVVPANVVLEGYSSTAPLIESPASSTSVLVTMAGANSTILHFRVKPMTTNNCIRSSASGITVDDIEFVNNAGGPTCSYGVYLSGPSAPGYVVNNVVADTYHKSGSGFIYVRGNNSQITNNVIRNLTFDGFSNMNVIFVHSGYSSNSPNLLVAKNVIGHITHNAPVADTEWCNVMALEYFRGATARNNLIFDIDNKNTGGWTWGIDTYQCTNATFEHNTISGMTGPAWIYAFETTDYYQDSSGITHRDHIITNLTAGTMGSWRWAYLGRFSNNLSVNYSCAYSVGNAFRDQCVQGVGFVSANPQFLDPANDDFRVASGSPCEDAAHDGTDMGAYGGSDPLTWLP